MTQGYATAAEFDRLGKFGPMAAVLGLMDALALPLQESPPPYEVRWFSSDGSVVIRGLTSSVFIGGTMIDEVDERDPDRGRRNVLVVELARSGELHLGRLASAFGITDEYLRQLRRDVGATFHVVAVPPDRDPLPVRSFQSFTGDLHALADWLKSVGITTIAMRSTGVYWVPVFEILEERGFEVLSPIRLP
jgi:hypothetical protein